MKKYHYIFTLIFILAVCCPLSKAYGQSSPADIEYAVGVGGAFSSSPEAEFAVAIRPLLAFPSLPAAGEFTAIMYLPTSMVTGNEVFTILDDFANGGIMIYQPPGFAHTDGNTYFSFVYSGSGIDLSQFGVGNFQLVFSVDVANGNPAASWQIADGTTGLFADFGVRSELNVLGFNELVSAMSAVLPVELVDFEVELITGQSHITWKTASEINSDYFQVERSTDGHNFAIIEEVSAAGFSNALVDYAILDKQPEPGPNYYRLKQVDFDNSFSYSAIRAVFLAGPAVTFQLYPNPAREVVTLSLPPDITKAHLQIMDASGKSVLEQPLEAGAARLELPVSNWRSGLYLVRLRVNGEVLTKRLIVTN